MFAGSLWLVIHEPMGVIPADLFLAPTVGAGLPSKSRAVRAKETTVTDMKEAFPYKKASLYQKKTFWEFFFMRFN